MMRRNLEIQQYDNMFDFELESDESLHLKNSLNGNHNWEIFEDPEVDGRDNDEFFYNEDDNLGDSVTKERYDKLFEWDNITRENVNQKG